MGKRISKATSAASVVIAAHASEAAETKSFCEAVEKAIQTNLKNGYPVARYDPEKRCPYMEYLDGKRVYEK